MADLMPPVLATDPRLHALARLSERLSALDVSVVLTYLIDTVDAELLPVLAEQFHIMGDEGWALANTEERRRALIKQSIEIHRRKGTVWAVERVLEALRVSAELTEWWQTEPRGTPYTFELLAWVNDNIAEDAAVLSTELYQRLRSLVANTKPVRTGFTFRVGARFDAGLAAANGAQAAAVGRWPATPVTVQPPPAAQPLRAACAAHSLTVIRISMEAR